MKRAQGETISLNGELRIMNFESPPTSTPNT
jgi:hypothetical protein